MFSFHKQFPHETTEHSRTLLQSRVLAEATDAEIDRLAYALYGLTEDEVTVVEENTLA